MIPHVYFNCDFHSSNPILLDENYHLILCNNCSKHKQIPSTYSVKKFIPSDISPAIIGNDLPSSAPPSHQSNLSYIILVC